MEVLDNEGNVSLNEQTILERWRVDFQNLYNGSGSEEFNNDHYNHAISDKTLENLLWKNSFINAIMK